MQSRPPIHNIDDYAAVCVCFHEHLISCLFADLLEARGVPTKIVNCLTNPRQVTKIITEPQYFVTLSAEQQQHCLVVGTPESLAFCAQNGVNTLSRPLTEEKIDTALANLLRTH